jgi:hypothetical protein
MTCLHFDLLQSRTVPESSTGFPHHVDLTEFLPELRL